MHLLLLDPHGRHQVPSCLPEGQRRLRHNREVNGATDRLLALAGGCRAASHPAVQDLRHGRHLPGLFGAPLALRRQGHRTEVLMALRLAQRIPHIRRERLPLLILHEEVANLQARNRATELALELQHVRGAAARQLADAALVRDAREHEVEAAAQDRDQSHVGGADALEHTRERAVVLVGPDDDEGHAHRQLRAHVQEQVAEALGPRRDGACERADIHDAIDREEEHEADGETRAEAAAGELRGGRALVLHDPHEHVPRGIEVQQEGRGHKGPTRRRVRGEHGQPREDDVEVRDDDRPR
mmetsp:Transcript_8083/g.18457  ORF Transcript_8083/g.18457 Transcript_8083/m.18457 type:complete len:299 (+) Transcript_8083:1380-2276(+)